MTWETQVHITGMEGKKLSGEIIPRILFVLLAIHSHTQTHDIAQIKPKMWTRISKTQFRSSTTSQCLNHI